MKNKSKKEKLKKSNNPDFWINKIERNMQRDLENEKKLLFLGWTVVRFWGQEILKDTEGCVKTIEEIVVDNLLQETNNQE